MDARIDGVNRLYWMLGVAMLGLWGTLGSVSAQPLSRVEARGPADSVTVGERFVLTIVAERSAEAEVQFPTADAGGDVFGALEVIAGEDVQTRSREDGRVVDSVAYEVTTFALDSVRIPSLPVRAVAGTDTIVASTAAHTVPVASVVPPDAKGLRPGNPLAPFPSPLWTWLVWGAVAAALTGGGYLWWRRQQQRPESVGEHSRAATPYEAATDRLRTLEAHDLTDPEAIKPFYVELSDIVRVYLARELDVAAPERTTREVEAMLDRRADVPADAAKQIQVVLERADLVKFAGVRPQPDSGRETLRAARAALDAIESASPGPSG